MSRPWGVITNTLKRLSSALRSVWVVISRLNERPASQRVTLISRFISHTMGVLNLNVNTGNLAKSGWMLYFLDIGLVGLSRVDKQGSKCPGIDNSFF